MQATPLPCAPPELCELIKPIFPGMKHPNLRSSVLLALLLPLVTALPAQAKSDLEQIEVSVGRLLEEGHYTHQSLNDDVSKKFLRTYLEILDFSHLFFTQRDVD